MDTSSLSNAPAEQALVGLAMLRPVAYDDAACAPEDFELPLARASWEAIGELRRKNHDITPLSISQSVPPRAGSTSSVTGVLLEWANAIHRETPEALGRLIRQAAMARRLAASCARTLDDLKRGDIDVEDILGEHRGTVASIESAERDEPVSLGDALPGSMDEIESRAAGRDAHSIKTGIAAYDQAIGGFRPKQQIVVAARPGEGKSSYALGTVVNAAEGQGTRCLIFSMEMSIQEQIERILSGKSNVSATKMATGNLGYAEWRRIQGIASVVGGLPIWLYDDSLTLDKLLATARRWHARHVKPKQVALIVIDYLGLVKAKEHRVREQEIAAISRAGKDLAKTLSCVVMQVAQLNRNSEKENRDPILADLRESGAIEQDANTVIFPVRDKGGEDNSGEGPARLIVAKNRGGPVGAVPVWWCGRLTKYQDRRDEPESGEDE